MNRSRRNAALVPLFVASGCAALIYEVVWFQLLELVIGSSAVSTGVLLGTFMAGMGLGSLLVPRVIPYRWSPLRVYAGLEIGIGLIGLAVLFGMPIIGSAYTAWAGTGAAGFLVRGAAAFVCLLPPTVLMGATLPVVARAVGASTQGVSWLGFLYGSNTAGAVAGTLVAGFYLLRVHDVAIATYVAVGLNIVVALFALIVPAEPTVEPPAPTSAVIVADRWVVYLVIGLSGATALAAQVIWTRILSLMLGATVYTFSLVLAVFLMGMGLGSAVASALVPTLNRPRRALAWCQLGLCAAIAWTAYILTQSLPYWPVNPSISTHAWFQFQLDLTRTLYAVLPGALLWGASFPLALVAARSHDDDPARLVGGVYAANTCGAIVGSLGASLLLIVWLGSQVAQQLLVAAAGVSALLLLWRERAALVTGVLVGTAAAIFALAIPALPGLLVAYGRYAVFQVGQADIIYMGEGWNAAVAVSERAGGVRNYHNAGKVQASSEPQDMRLQRMLGHLTTLVPESPRSVLVIGCGAGVTAGAVSIDPAVERETIAEIEPLVPEVVSTYFSEHNFDVINNPKVRIELDDARHFLQVSEQTFDAITSDPLDPWVKGAAMLYTTEFFELVKRRLNPGGVVTIFVQLYESNVEAVKSEIGTFFEAFPHGMIFANTFGGEGYDLVLLGRLEPGPIDVDAVQARLDRPEYEPLRQSLAAIGMYSAVDLLATFAGHSSDFVPWLADAEINRDRNLRLQYLAGRGLNVYQAAAIFKDMLNFAGAPEKVFVGSADRMTLLTHKIRIARGR